MRAWEEVQIGVAALDTERERRFATFVAEHRDRALGLAWRLVGGDRAAAEDVTQEAFVRAWQNLDRFREEARLSTWFHRILVNEANRHLRWRWVRQKRAAALPADPPDPAAGPGDALARARVARAVAALPRGQREAFVLVHLEGLSLAEAAGITGRAVGTIKSHLHRATRALRRELADLAPASNGSPA